MAAQQALAGLKVLDFSWVAAGPLVGKCLADHGATVIKVESTETLDVVRLSGPFSGNVPGPNRSGTFASLNSNKYSLSLHLRNPRSLELVKQLARWADVALENYRPGVTKRLGIAYSDLSKDNERLVYLSLAMQGQTGPHASLTGFGWNLNSLASFTHLTGWPDREPVNPGVAYPDVVVPWFGLSAVLAALDYRDRTGKGQHIDLSQLEASLQFLTPVLMDYTVNGREEGRDGNHSSHAAPHGAYRSKGEDDWCVMAVSNDAEWQSLCRVMGKPDLAAEPRFRTLEARKGNEAALDELVESWTQTLTASEAMMTLQAAGIAAGVVQNAADLIDKDPQLRYRKYFELIEQPEIGPFPHGGWPAQLSETPGKPRIAAPGLGEHNAYVCSEILGLSDEEFIELLSDGVFGL